MAQGNIDGFTFEDNSTSIDNAEVNRLLIAIFDHIDHLYADAWPLVISKAKVLAGEWLLTQERGKSRELLIREALIKVLQTYPIMKG